MEFPLLVGNDAPRETTGEEIVKILAFVDKCPSEVFYTLVMKHEPFDNVLAVLRALGEVHRLRIWRALLVKECCVGEIQNFVGLSISSISRHLSILGEAGLVASRRKGKWVHYRAAIPEGETWMTDVQALLVRRLDEGQQIRDDMARLLAHRSLVHLSGFCQGAQIELPVWRILVLSPDNSCMCGLAGGWIERFLAPYLEPVFLGRKEGKGDANVRAVLAEIGLEPPTCRFHDPQILRGRAFDLSISLGPVEVPIPEGIEIRLKRLHLPLDIPPAGSPDPEPYRLIRDRLREFLLAVPEVLFDACTTRCPACCS